jgi:nucleoside-diphosphate-sugar epimerase
MNKVIEEDFNLIYSHTKSIWDKLQYKTIFITGATGFFGKCLLQNFILANKKLNLNIKIVALSRDPRNFIEKNLFFNDSSIEYIKGDVKDFKFPDAKIDYIIHAATDANIHLIASDSMAIYDTIVDGTKRVLELANQKKIQTLLYISSGAVYGKQPHNITHVSEEYLGGPNVYDKDASYGEGKRIAEMLCQIYYKNHNVNSKIARCFSFVGTHLPLDAHFAIGNFINNILNHKQIQVQGDGSTFRAYLYSADLVIWLLKIMDSGLPCRPYNVGSDEEINIEGLATIINSHSEKKQNIEILQPKTNQNPLRYVPSIKRAKDELGLAVFTNLKDSINRTILFNKN